jgi:hypothetical protein
VACTKTGSKNDLFLNCRRKPKELSKKELSNVVPASSQSSHITSTNKTTNRTTNITTNKTTNGTTNRTINKITNRTTNLATSRTTNKTTNKDEFFLETKN